MAKITKVAVKLNGKVYAAPVGHTHQDIRKANGLEGKGRAQRGFITSTGAFVGREEGAKIALAAGQTKGTVTEGKLHSTDLKGYRK